MADWTLIDAFLRLYLDAIGAAQGPLETFAGEMVRALMWITFVGVGLSFTAGATFENGVGQFVRWLLLIFVVGLGGANWTGILAGLLEAGVGLGGQIGGLGAGDLLTVSAIMRTSLRILDPIYRHMAGLCTGPWTCAVNYWSLVLYVLAWLVVAVSFAIITLQLVFAQLGFYFSGLATLLTIWAVPIRALSWMAERGIGGLVAGFLHMFCIAAVVGIGMAIFDRMNVMPDLTIHQAGLFATVAVAMAIMAWKAKAFADSVVAGSGPNLSGNGVGGALGRWLAMATAGMIGGGAALAAQGYRSFRGGDGSSDDGPSQPEAARAAAAAGGQFADGGGRAPLSYGAGSPFRPARGGVLPDGRTWGGDWLKAPTDKQKHAAKRSGIDISGMNRGQASEALERAGLEESWHGSPHTASGRRFRKRTTKGKS
jgi:type IV secretory pathway TrbL component